ncbi:hypothetical protein QFC21_003862 [Naganishia friedmannii]|uniref:Uncharacterized protein n=1 Tax=Naganishia friedmannii TaxID=89922 RepID=A0ACC2VL45_9TREE|nr:hypothetical protein QFC21_003862 [Naganishia friedmannii]
MSFTPPRTTKSTGYAPYTTREGSPFGTNKGHTTPAKNVAYSPSAHLSPALSNLKKHSLYGTEDRVIIDPGSRIWKVGFSGEARPRRVFWSTDTQGDNDESDGTMWDLDFDDMLNRLNASRSLSINAEPSEHMNLAEYEEVLQIIKARLTAALRSVYVGHLLTESKSRKVIIVENALLPNQIKRLISEVLFDNLKVPSVSFTSGHMLTLMATGNTTGLVVDFGFHETTVVPVYQSRVLYPYLTTTPIAGKAFLQRLRRLIEAFASYTPPVQSKRPVRPDPKRPALTHVETDNGRDDQEQTESTPVLDWRTLEDVRSRGCFVGTIPLDNVQRPDDAGDLEHHAQAYSAGSEAKDATFVVKRSDVNGDTSNGLIKVPGWVRERAAEVFFEDGDVDAMSVVEVILSCVTSLPIDLRKTMISSIVVSGGACMLPGFISRLRIQLLQRILLNAEDSIEDKPAPATAAQKNHPSPLRNGKPTAYQREQCRRGVERTKTQHKKPFRLLVPLASNLTILNDSDPMLDDESNPRAGGAPPFNPGLLPWIGGSIAGALQIGSQEVLREPEDDPLRKSTRKQQQQPKIPVWSESTFAAIPDWSRSLIPSASV